MRYDEVNAMLLNEFLKEQKKVEEQTREIIDLKSALRQQSEQMKDFAARLEARSL